MSLIAELKRRSVFHGKNGTGVIDTPLIAYVPFFALLLAWYHGERGAQKASGPELLLLAIGGGLLWRFAPGPAA